MTEETFTTAPVGTDDAEFCDLVQLKRRFGIGRSLAYILIGDGDLQSKVLRRPGNIKGKRLIFVPSVRQYIARQPSDVDPVMSANCRKAQKVSAQKKAERPSAPAGAL